MGPGWRFSGITWADPISLVCMVVSEARSACNATLQGAQLVSQGGEMQLRRAVWLRMGVSPMAAAPSRCQDVVGTQELPVTLLDATDETRKRFASRSLYPIKE